MAGKASWPPRLVVAQQLHATLALSTPEDIAAVRVSALRTWLDLALSPQLQVWQAEWTLGQVLRMVIN
jgi:hypothetical protein